MKVVKAINQNHFADAFRIRAHVFVGEQKVSPLIEIDHYDNEMPIFNIYKDEIPVGTGRIILGEKIAKIGRVAVLKEYRKLGAGSQLILGMIDYLREQTEIKEVKIVSQLKAVSFFEKLGFVSQGETFVEANIEHVAMTYQLRK